MGNVGSSILRQQENISYTSGQRPTRIKSLTNTRRFSHTSTSTVSARQRGCICVNREKFNFLPTRSDGEPDSVSRRIPHAGITVLLFVSREPPSHPHPAPSIFPHHPTTWRLPRSRTPRDVNEYGFQIGYGGICLLFCQLPRLSQATSDGRRPFNSELAHVHTK